MDFFNPWYIIIAGVGSCIGMGAFIYGKRMQDAKCMFVGIGLCAVSYFITEPLTLGVISALLVGVLFSNPIIQMLEGPRKDIESIE